LIDNSNGGMLMSIEHEHGGLLMVAALSLGIGFGVAACDSSLQSDIDPSTSDEIESREASASDSCTQVQDWFDENRQRLPSSYDAIIRYPDQYRRAIVPALPPAVQSALWRTQIERFASSRIAMSPDQSETLEAVFELLSPLFFAAHLNSPESDLATNETAHIALDQVAEAFGADEAGMLLGHFGPVDITGPGNVDSSSRATAPRCICNTNNDHCWLIGNSKCTHGVIPCTALVRGCGRLLLESCNGFCTPR
jgi:hypothetical protein